MKCQFEEKQYETLLNSELVESNENIYVPGQVLEGKIGFDAAVYSKNKKFWIYFKKELARTRSSKKGVEIKHEWWSELEKTINYFPPIKMNIFIQHKRPEYIKNSRGKEWKSWRKGYFRYDLTPHQQIALANLEKNVAKEALVVYASPSFYKLDDLWKNQQNREIVSNSNFCTAGNLTGHGRYSYTVSGNNGVAHSEPEEIVSLDLNGWLREQQQPDGPEGADYEDTREIKTNTENINGLGKAMEESISGADELHSMYRVISKSVAGPEPTEFVASAAKIWAFLFMTNLRWYATL